MLRELADRKAIAALKAARLDASLRSCSQCIQTTSDLDQTCTHARTYTCTHSHSLADLGSARLYQQVFRHLSLNTWKRPVPTSLLSPLLGLVLQSVFDRRMLLDEDINLPCRCGAQEHYMCGAEAVVPKFQ